MKILVIGGSYFLGRWFVQHAYKKSDITVLNRGNIPVGLEGVRELKADRHDINALKELKLDEYGYEAVVDFCAYNKGDIKTIIDSVDKNCLKKYIFISTVDVYKKGSGSCLTENAELEAVSTEDAQSEYISGKIALEEEIAEECMEYGIKPVSVRPSVIYGPGNYAPRESIYIEWIKNAGQILHPIDATGYWQMIYVSDAAKALVKLCEMSENKIETAYNFTSSDFMDYVKFEKALRAAYELKSPGEKAYDMIEVQVEQVIKRGIPLPFVLTKEESECYSSKRYDALGINTTPVEKGLKACIDSLGI
ncbi:MAG: NAD-dependent epimerase/dehydratase family protein [Lachnospiraceae bacterium]|nr:NAD-dependent epimerase/dehydratase family protein [Lachnospiraceae bacterium]